MSIVEKNVNESNTWLYVKATSEDIYVHTPEEDAILDKAIEELDAGLGVPQSTVDTQIQKMLQPTRYFA
ncbi:MAG: hypothetical protein ACRC2T_13765 [Thermoguttaceae bacterium]